MKVLVVSFFPGNGSGESVGGFDWFPDTPLGCELVRQRLQGLLGASEYSVMPDSSVTVARLDVPVDETLRGWWDAVTQWIDDNRELRELPIQDEVT